MSKQHFEWAASYVRDMTDDDRWQVLEAFVSMFRRFGPRFDEGRFRRACEPRPAKRVRA